MIFFILLTFSNLWANIVMDEVLTIDRLKFPLKTVCGKVLNDDFPLVGVASGTEVDCMGTKVDVAKFCDQELASDPYYIRAYVDQTEKLAVCQTGKSVIFKYQCVKLTDKKICETAPKSACESFQEKLAKKLDLVHYSKVKNAKGHEQVNCFFEASPSLDKKWAL